MILTVGERAVTNRFDLERSLWGHKAGDVVAAKVVRDGKETPVSLTLSEGRVASADTTPQTGTAEATTRPVGEALSGAETERDEPGASETPGGAGAEETVRTAQAGGTDCGSTRLCCFRSRVRQTGGGRRRFHTPRPE